jgi:hypothetical protein
MYPLAAVVLAIASALLVYNPTIIGLPASTGSLALVVTVPLAVYLIWRWTTQPTGDTEREIAFFAAWGDRTPNVRPKASEQAATYRSTPKTEPVKLDKVPPPTLKTVTALPSELAHVLDQVGGGTPRAFFEVHPKIAYVAIIGADPTSVSEYTSVVLRLEEPAPTFELHPLVQGDPLPVRTIAFKDAEFAARFVIEGDDPKATRAFLIPDLRDELLENPDVHLVVAERALSVTFFGPFSRARAMKLVDLADVFFAEFGAEGGPALREPFDKAIEAAEGAATKKKKKKKKAAEEDAPSALEPATADGET